MVLKRKFKKLNYNFFEFRESNNSAKIKKGRIRSLFGIVLGMELPDFTDFILGSAHSIAFFYTKG